MPLPRIALVKHHHNKKIRDLSKSDSFFSPFLMNGVYKVIANSNELAMTFICLTYILKKSWIGIFLTLCLSKAIMQGRLDTAVAVIFDIR